MTTHLRTASLAGFMALALVAALSPVACGTDRGDFDNDSDTPLTPAHAAVDADPCAGLRCSRDLKRVETGCGVVTETCGPGQGCANGSCVDACASAAAAQGSVGCSFWTLPPDDLTTDTGDACFATTIANTWDKPVRVSAEYDGKPLDLTRSTFTLGENGTDLVPLDGPLPPSGLAIVFLSQGQPQNLANGNTFSACPEGVTPALSIHPTKHGTAKTKAIHLTTDIPVSVYSVFPYGGAASYVPSASLLLPTSSWGDNYIAIDAWERLIGFTPSMTAVPFIQIVANDDDTVVRILPKVDIVGGDGVAAGAKGLVSTYTLARGEVLQLTQVQELIGSVVETNRQVGFFGGSTCMNVPSSVGTCDTAQQQIPPVKQWGSRYVLAPHRSRLSGPGESEGAAESVPWRLVGAVDGTVLSYDPVAPDGAPTKLAAGEMVTFWSSTPFVVQSQDADHPLYAAAYMTGSEFLNGGDDGDPEFVNVVPTGQYLDRYVFSVDGTFARSWVDLVRQKTAKGFADVTLDCAGVLEGWKDVGTTGEFQRLSVKFRAGQGAQCGNGRHEIASDGGFAVTVWGIDSFASYAYPGGTGSRPIADIQVPIK